MSKHIEIGLKWGAWSCDGPSNRETTQKDLLHQQGFSFTHTGKALSLRWSHSTWIPVPAKKSLQKFISSPPPWLYELLMCFRMIRSLIYTEFYVHHTTKQFGNNISKKMVLILYHIIFFSNRLRFLFPNVNFSWKYFAVMVHK